MSFTYCGQNTRPLFVMLAKTGTQIWNVPVACAFPLGFPPRLPPPDPQPEGAFQSNRKNRFQRTTQQRERKILDTTVFAVLPILLQKAHRSV
jgi:hypothetical protein